MQKCFNAELRSQVAVLGRGINAVGGDLGFEAVTAVRDFALIFIVRVVSEGCRFEHSSWRGLRPREASYVFHPFGCFYRLNG